MDTKKKARDDALQFLETLEINEDKEGNGEETQEKDTAAGGNEEEKGDASKNTTEAEGKNKEDPKSMLKFIDDLTESAKQGSGSPPPQDSKQGASGAAGPPGEGGWSWGGIWGQAAALVEQNSQLKSGLGKLRESIDNVRNAEASKALEGRVRTLVTQENIHKLGGDLKRSLDTVMDTLAPPIQEHEVFTVHLVNNIDDRGLNDVIYHTTDAVFDFHGCGEVNVKALDDADAPEMKTKRGDTFTLPKGFDGGYGAAVTAIQYAQHAKEASQKNKKEEPSSAAADTADDSSKEAKASQEQHQEEMKEAAAGSESPLFYRAHKTALYLAVQPFSAIPIEDQGFLGLCVVLRDPSRNVTLRTFSQMLPLSCWAQPSDQIVAADVDVGLGSTVNTRSDSLVQRRQEMNEECLYEAVMLSVKSLANEYLTERPPAVSTA